RSCDIAIGPHRFSGVGRVFLVDDKGMVAETKAPFFDELWQYRNGTDIVDHALEVVREAEAKSVRFRDRANVVGNYLSTLDHSKWDAAYRTFIEGAQNSPPLFPESKE